MPKPVLCLCGCGLPAPIAPRTRSRFGWRKGEPLRYRPGHHMVDQASTAERREASAWRRGRGASIDAYFVPEPNSGCWLWIGPVAPNGYGHYRPHGHGRPRMVAAHRALYELEKGAIPPGLQIDHLCRVRSCVNPAHLEAVTASENQRRWRRQRA